MLRLSGSSGALAPGADWTARSACWAFSLMMVVVVELVNGVQLRLGFGGVHALISALDPVVVDPDEADQDDDQSGECDLDGREGWQT
jgi:hypothetical protein